MRVLIVSAHFRPHVGGIERFSETLAEGLAERGHDIRVLCCRTDATSPLDEDGPYGVRRVPSSPWPERQLGVPYPLPSPLPLLQALRGELAGADVVHVQDALYASSVAALLLARRRRVPSLLTQHVAFVPQGNRLLDAAQHAAVATIGRTAGLASKVVALNAEVAAWAERRWKVAEVGVAPVGVAAPEPFDRADARRELGIDPGRFIALFVGRDVPKKGLDLVLAAAGPEYELVAVTDRAGPAPPGARLLPFVAKNRLERLYAAADAFVLPSEAEGIPVALQEAMAAGLPVVTPYLPGYTDRFLLTDIAPIERTAASVRAALVALAANPSERERLAARSRAVAASSFSLEGFVDAYEGLLRELVR